MDHFSSDSHTEQDSSSAIIYFLYEELTQNHHRLSEDFNSPQPTVTREVFSFQKERDKPNLLFHVQHFITTQKERIAILEMPGSQDMKPLTSSSSAAFHLFNLQSALIHLGYK